MLRRSFASKKRALATRLTRRQTAPDKLGSGGRSVSRVRARADSRRSADVRLTVEQSGACAVGSCWIKSNQIG